MDDLSLAQGAKSTLVSAADDVGGKVAALYGGIVGDAVSPESVGEFVRAALPILRRGVTTGGSLANAYHRRARRAAGITSAAPRLSPQTFNAEQAESSLRFLGLVQPAKAQGVVVDVPFTLDDPEKVKDKIEAAASRRVVQSSMDAAVAAARADRQAIGWARVTRGADACYFCSMLESRGTVYSMDSFAASDPRFKENRMPPEILSGELAAKAHDYCRCVLVPVFSRTSSVQQNADKLYDVWKKVQAQYGWLARRRGLSMIDIWRLYWEGRIEDMAAKYV